MLLAFTAKSAHLALASLLRLILPFEIDIRMRKYILHRWYGEIGSYRHHINSSPFDVVTCVDREMNPYHLPNDAVLSVRLCVRPSVRLTIHRHPSTHPYHPFSYPPA